MRLDKEQLFGISIMVVGSFIASDGITNVKFSYTTIGFVMIGFAVFLWTASNRLTEDIKDEKCPEE